MWRYVTNDGYEVVGSRYDVVEALNILTYYNDEIGEDELFDVNRESHWNWAVSFYGLTGGD